MMTVPLVFQSTLPARGATSLATACRVRCLHFNPRSPRGERRRAVRQICSVRKDFNPRSPRGERPQPIYRPLTKTYFNPRSPRGERHGALHLHMLCNRISIHAPREGSDATRDCYTPCGAQFQSTLPARGATRSRWRATVGTCISIHAPREGSDSACIRRVSQWLGFQSTLPARGATGHRAAVAAYVAFQSTLPARGATTTARYVPCARQFQSTLPARGATGRSAAAGRAQNISIHAPREGSDEDRGLSQSQLAKFQSTLPARGATLCQRWVVQVDKFQSTLPARGATRRQKLLPIFYHQFQSTLPARGATWWYPQQRTSTFHFNPRSPRGERPVERVAEAASSIFQSTLPARGATRQCDPRLRAGGISIHAPREGSDPARPS